MSSYVTEIRRALHGDYFIICTLSKQTEKSNYKFPSKINGSVKDKLQFRLH
jgi:hypothetical protein